MDFHFSRVNDDALGNGFHNLALFFAREFRPAGIEVTGTGNDFFLGEVGDFENIEFRLYLGNLIFELPLT